MFGINLVGETLQGRYHITQKLGEGGFGETYLAIDRANFDEPCVVKRLKPQNQTNIKWVQQAFEQEAQMLKRLGKHPQIPDLLAYFPEQQEFFLVQEYIEGNNLRTQINLGSQCHENLVIFWMQYILEILEFVHQKGVIHRDIKPENIIIQKKDNKLVLIDFGAVKQVSTQVFNTQGQLTATTVVVGTPGYMPMEQMRGHPALCSDVYAVGMIGIEALTGILPSNIPLDPNNLKLVLRNQAQVTNKVADVLDKMVRYAPSERYQSASEALQAIRSLTKTIYPSQPPIQPPVRPPIPTPIPTPLSRIHSADVGRRLMAYLIDFTILCIGSAIVNIAVFGLSSVNEYGLIFFYIVLGFLYCPAMESSSTQGTLGKMIVGIAVTDLDGKRITWEQATKRHGSKLLSYLTLFVGFFMSLGNQKQSLHDKVSGCLVVRK